MGLFNFFKKKQNDIKITSTAISHTPTPKDFSNERAQAVREISKIRSTCYPSSNGLYPDEIMLLSYAPKYMTTNNKFPAFWATSYGISNPQIALQQLCTKGFIRIATAEESLNALKATKLKELLEGFGLPSSGNKKALIARLTENATETALNKIITERYYVLTPLGEQELKSNEYVVYMHKHSSSLGISVWDLNKILHSSRNMNYKDAVWRELNRRYITVAKSISDNSLYSNADGVGILITMSDFLAEEKRYAPALSPLSQAAFYSINNTNAVSYKNYSSVSAKKTSYYEFLRFSPYYSKKFIDICKELNLSYPDLRQKLIDNMKVLPIRYQVLTAQQTADFIIAEISGDTRTAQSICQTAEKQIKQNIL